MSLFEEKLLEIRGAEERGIEDLMGAQQIYDDSMSLVIEIMDGMDKLTCGEAELADELMVSKYPAQSQGSFVTSAENMNNMKELLVMNNMFTQKLIEKCFGGDGLGDEQDIRMTMSQMDGVYKSMVDR